MFSNARVNFLHFDGKRKLAFLLVLTRASVALEVAKQSLRASVQIAITWSTAVRGVNRNIGGHISSAVLCCRWIKMIPARNISIETMLVPQTLIFQSMTEHGPRSCNRSRLCSSVLFFSAIVYGVPSGWVTRGPVPVPICLAGRERFRVCVFPHFARTVVGVWRAFSSHRLGSGTSHCLWNSV